MIKVTYLDNTLELPEGTTVENARHSLAVLFPEISNAEATQTPDGDINFRVQAGKKGSEDALRVVYGDNVLSLPAQTTDEAARESLKVLYPEIANATAERSGGTLTFRVQAGKKGI